MEKNFLKEYLINIVMNRKDKKRAMYRIVAVHTEPIVDPTYGSLYYRVEYRNPNWFFNLFPSAYWNTYYFNGECRCKTLEDAKYRLAECSRGTTEIVYEKYNDGSEKEMPMIDLKDISTGMGHGYVD